MTLADALSSMVREARIHDKRLVDTETGQALAALVDAAVAWRACQLDERHTAIAAMTAYQALSVAVDRWKEATHD